MKKPSVLCIIPAKGTSKRIPGKNLKMLAGKPMLAHILDTVKSAKGVDRVIVSTDSEDIKKVAVEHGADVPFIRPKELTGDDVITQQVLDHALRWLEANESYVPDYVLLLYATSPLLKRERIEEAIRIATDRDSDSVISGSYDKGHYWIEGDGAWVRLYPVKVTNSQYQVPLFVENGAIYLTKSRFIKRQYVADKADILIMEPGENIDVDYPEDFAAVEKILTERAS